MHHLILGAGPAGITAAETLRALQPEASITVLAGEAEPPYARMAIPYMLIGKILAEGTYLRHDPGHYAAHNIHIRHGVAARIDPVARRVKLADGGALAYDRLLIATGAQPLRPPISGIDLPHIHHCWTLADARTIAARAEAGRRVVLLGAGFIGCIVLEALALRGVALTVVEAGARMVPRMMNPAASKLIRRWCESKGVRILTDTRVTGIVPDSGNVLKAVTDSGKTLQADLMVVAAGVQPRIDWLTGCGLATRRGLLVDRKLETSLPGIFAAGDVAEGLDFTTGTQDVHAIQPTAVEHGRIAAHNMAGQPLDYQGSVPMNVLDTLGLVSSSFGQWAGVEGGDGVERLDKAGFRYINLQFRDDVLVGATAVGLMREIGMLRGLLQGRVHLGAWKARLLADPHQLAHAYVGCMVARG